MISILEHDAIRFAGEQHILHWPTGVAPRPGGGITHARTHHDSPHGRIAIAWQLDGERGSIDVAVPPGTEAELVLPDGDVEPLAPGPHHRTWRAR